MKRTSIRKQIPKTGKDFEKIKAKAGEDLYRAFIGDMDVYEFDTPFGTLVNSEAAMPTHIRDKTLLFEVMVDDEADNEQDDLDRLVRFEKLNMQHPNEPFVLNTIAMLYQKLKRGEQYEEKVVSNYQQRFEYPLIDIEYVRLQQQKEGRDNVIREVFGEMLDLHAIYPNQEQFSDSEIEGFYEMRALAFARQKKFDKANDCYKVLEIIKSDRATMLRLLLQEAQYPWKKWRNRFLAIGLLVLIVLLVLGLLYWAVLGVVRLFQWIF